MNTMTIELFDLWTARWEELLSYRRDLTHWKRTLKAATRDHRRTGLDGYLDEIKDARYAIQQLEYHIADLRAKLNNDHYPPYDVLQLPADACGKQIFQAYSCLRQEAERACLKWANLLESANTQTKKVIFSHNLEKTRFILKQIELAYDRLRLLKPYYPGGPRQKKLLAMVRRGHLVVRLRQEPQTVNKEPDSS